MRGSVRDQRSPINLPTMADLDDLDDDGVVVNGVENSVVTLADTIFFSPRQLLTAGRAGIIAQGFDPVQDAAQVGIGIMLGHVIRNSPGRGSVKAFAPSGHKKSARAIPGRQSRNEGQ